MLSLHKLICKNASIGPKNLGSKGKDWNKGKVGIWPRKQKTLVKIT